MSLCIGTAQFGMDYGISNTSGKVSYEDAKGIIDTSKKIGISKIDTAPAYGNAEECIGKLDTQGQDIISKLPSKPNNILDIESWFHESLNKSLKDLNRENIYGYLIHRVEDLFEHSDELLNLLIDANKQNLIKKIGVSIYSPSDLEKVFKLHHFDIVQVPFNVFDTRILDTGWLQKLKKNNVEVHTRSAFLQGLLLISRNKISPSFGKWKDNFNLWHDWIEDNNIDAVQACLRFVNSFKMIDEIVIGFENKRQLLQAHEFLTSESPEIDFPDLSCDDELLINPMNWRST